MRKNFLLIFILFFCSAFSRPTTFDDRKNCEETNGAWREFGNSCIDECEAKLDSYPICTDITVSACECGKSRCWDDEKKSCVALSDYKKIFTVKKDEEKKLAEESKKKRQEASEENQQEILSNVVSTNKPEEKKVTNNVAPPATPPVVEQPKEEVKKPAQPPSAIVSSPPQIPPLFLQREKAKQESEENKPAPSLGLPIIPLPQ